jgi:hypothetical protein
VGTIPDLNNNGIADIICGSTDSYVRALEGNPQITSDISGSADEISDYMIENSYPNPFNNNTKINFFVPKLGMITIQIFDLRGRVVKCLLNRIVDQGAHHIIWDGTDHLNKSVSSGIYICRITFREYNNSIKLVYMK